MRIDNTNEDVDSYRRRCILCSNPRQADTGLPYCAEHFRQYQARQQEKVPIENMDPNWLDRVSVWRNCPLELADEPFADRLLYRWTWEDWVLFWMGYPTRLPDWLAVNMENGQTRRFVEIAQPAVQDALHDGTAVSYQAGLRIRWGHQDRWLISTHGRSGRIPWYEYFRGLFENRLRLLNVIDTIPFPLYGPVLHSQHKLALKDVALSNDDSMPVEIRLTFANPDLPLPINLTERAGEVVVFSVGSAKVLATDYPLAPDAGYSRPLSSVPSFASLATEKYFVQLLEQVRQSLRGQYLDLRIDTMKGTERIYRGQLQIDHTLFTGDIIHWPQFNNTGLFMLRQYSSETEAVSWITGWAVGASAETLGDLLKGLVIVNERSDLLIQYQDDWDRYKASNRE